MHQVVVTGVILCQKDQMIVSVIPPGQLPVKPGSRSHIHLTAQYGFDALLFAGLIKIYHPIHHAVIRNSRSIHPHGFYFFYIVFHLVGAVQQTVLGVGMQMNK